jgi:hypothetical protein
MRRIVMSLAVLGAVSLGACSGGGTVLNSSGANTPDKVVLTTVGPTNIARVLPGASIAISAVALKGDGILSNNRFTWTAELVTSGTYTANTSGQQKACAVVTQTIGAVTSPFLADFSIYVTIDPTNEANILFSPPPTIPAPAGSILATNFPYCVVVSATSVGGGAVGSITVAVVNPQNPEQ